MTIESLKKYLLEKGFVETNRHTFSKKYKVRDTSAEDKNFITCIYKVSKGVVFFKVKGASQSRTLRKGSLEKIVVNENNELEGFKTIIEG